MANYPLVFALSLLLNIGITFRSSSYWNQIFGRQTVTSSSSTGDNDGSASSLLDPSAMDLRHQTLLKKYLVVYLLAALSDWLQGPYVYALYDGYGYSKHEIAVLFVAGFGSSMIFGSFVGGMADWGGRRTFALWFCVIYGASCLTKHFRSFTVLLLGRLLGGIATSLLFSVFDAWLIKSHTDASLSKPYLSKSFAWASYGNSVVAILAGLLANKVANLGATTTPGTTTSSSSTGHRQLAGAAPTTVNAMYAPFKSIPNWYVGGFINPFDVALVALILCGIFCRMWWDENYGDDDKVAAARNKSSASLKDNAGSSGNTTDNSHPWYGGLRNALTTTLRSRDILLCGIISSLFEGSMYIFVFMWTPQLKDLGTKPGGEQVQLPFGLIFSTFMVSCMAGSSLFSVLIDKTKGEILAVAVFGAATLAMAMVALAKTDTVCFLAMNLFEICVGMYWPIMGTMKGSIVPEDKRAAIYNLYRIPLNFIVLFSLLTKLTTMQSFTLNAVMLSVATFLQFTLMKQRLNGRGGGEVSSGGGSSPKSSADDEELAHLATNMASTEEGQEVQDSI